ncbi:MAG: hypothetical protein WA144_03330 [Candidatus Methanoperedens sp.]
MSTFLTGIAIWKSNVEYNIIEYLKSPSSGIAQKAWVNSSSILMKRTKKNWKRG